MGSIQPSLLLTRQFVPGINDSNFNHADALAVSVFCFF
jgi:hypothetical protein